MLRFNRAQRLVKWICTRYHPGALCAAVHYTNKQNPARTAWLRMRLDLSISREMLLHRRARACCGENKKNCVLFFVLPTIIDSSPPFVNCNGHKIISALQAELVRWSIYLKQKTCAINRDGTRFVNRCVLFSVYLKLAGDLITLIV